MIYLTNHRLRVEIVEPGERPMILFALTELVSSLMSFWTEIRISVPMNP